MLLFSPRGGPRARAVLCANVIDDLGKIRANKESITIGGASEELRLFGSDGPLMPVEINLEELPLFLFQSRGRSTQKVLETKDTLTLDSGERLEKYFKVTGSEEFGLPGPTDRDVYLAVIRLLQHSGGMPPDGRVGFSLYEIRNILGLTNGSKNYANIRRSIDRIGATLVYAENGFYNRQGEIFETHRFQPWRPFFRQTRAQGGQSERHVVRFDELLVKSYQSNYLKTLDADFHFSLDNAVAKLLYGLIDVRRAGTLAYSEEIQQLRRLIPLPESYYQPSRIKQRLDPAYRELIRRGFLTRVDYERRGSTEMVRHRISPDFVDERDAFAAALSTSERGTLERMAYVGVWPTKAREIISAYGADQCEIFLDALASQTNLRNPAAWVVRAIENDWRSALGKDRMSANISPSTPIRGPVAAPSGDPSSPSLPIRSLKEPDGENATCSISGDRQSAARRVEERYQSGEFDAAIQAFRNAPFSQYIRYVDTHSPVQADETQNRYYVSPDHDLYLCSTGLTEAESLLHICPLQRSDAQF